MKKSFNQLSLTILIITLFSASFLFQGCAEQEATSSNKIENETAMQNQQPEYFSLRPDVEKAFGYTHAVKVGNIIKVSGAVSMDDQGNPTAIGDMGQQMKNCYAALEKILAHYDCTFDNVIVENVFTTNMPQFLENAAYRREIYQNHFPTGTWLGVKELALPVFLIEIELEVYKPE